MSDQPFRRGGSFLIDSTEPNDVFTPEDFAPEHGMMRETVAKFVDREVLPLLPKIEKMDHALLKDLLHKAGELGLLGIDVAEEFGGAGMDKLATVIAAEEIGRAGSFSVSMGAHSGIGSLPIVYYGNTEQKKKYLPKLISAEWIAAFALTEPDCGSDAFSSKTKAVLNKEGTHYVLNGTKQFITNGGFADVFIVFAKIDGEHLTAFIVERGFAGLSSGPEEKKMGIKGSSTTPIILQDVKVPVENLLGEPGKGVKIALNILNTGRFKLGAGCLGASKDVIINAISYTSQRKQFGRPVNQFGLVQEKLANMAIRAFALESACYRTVGLIQKLVDSIDHTAPGHELQILKSIEEYSIECALMKVLGSETLDFVADEGVQCMGGYGYCEEYPMERAYRDSRINRIFEGTNEINRLVVTGMLIKKSMSGELPLMEAIKSIQKEMTELPEATEPSGLLGPEKQLVANLKKAALLVAGVATQKFGKALENEQEILARLADCIINIYALESTVIRAVKIAEKQPADKASIYLDIARVLGFETAERISSALKGGAAYVMAGDDMRVVLGALRRFCKTVPGDNKVVRRNLAKILIETGKPV